MSTTTIATITYRFKKNIIKVLLFIKYIIKGFSNSQIWLENWAEPIDWLAAA